MNLVGTVYSLEELNNCKNYIDLVMIEHEFLSNPYNSKCSVYELINEANKMNITPILKVNRMCHPFEMDKISGLLNEFIKYDCLFYVTDLGVVNILKKLNLLKRVIYDPVTMICNSLDAKNYLDMGFDSVGLSMEITIDDVKTISSKVNNAIFYKAFGYHLMFHSKRFLLSLYQEKIDKEIKGELWLEEATRNDKYPVIENEQGTLIYRSYIISLLKEIKNLNMKYAFFEHIRISDSDYLEVLKIYNEYLNDEIDLTLALQKIELLNLNIADGFMYQHTVYQKEEF